MNVTSSVTTKFLIGAGEGDAYDAMLSFRAQPGSSANLNYHDVWDFVADASTGTFQLQNLATTTLLRGHGND